MYALTQEDAHAANAMVSSILPICSIYVCFLFDFGVMHSFISYAFVWKHALPTISFVYDLCVATYV